jgi:hypothetical protein
MFNKNLVINLMNVLTNLFDAILSFNKYLLDNCEIHGLHETSTFSFYLSNFNYKFSDNQDDPR